MKPRWPAPRRRGVLDSREDTFQGTIGAVDVWRRERWRLTTEYLVILVHGPHDDDRNTYTQSDVRDRALRKGKVGRKFAAVQALLTIRENYKSTL